MTTGLPIHREKLVNFLSIFLLQAQCIIDKIKHEKEISIICIDDIWLALLIRSVR